MDADAPTMTKKRSSRSSGSSVSRKHSAGRKKNESKLASLAHEAEHEIRCCISDVLSRFRRTKDSLASQDTNEEALTQAQRLVSKERFKFRYSRPWEGIDGQPVWTTWRTLCGKVVLSAYFDWGVVLVILCNLVCIVYETNLEASCYPEYKNKLAECPDNGKDNPVLAVLSLLFVIFYSAEALLKIYVERSDYFKQHENCFDFGVCVTSVVTTALDSFVDVSWLRILRVSRLIRVFNLIANIPELRMLCVGFAGSMRAIFFGAVLIVCMLSLSSILLVQYIHPVCTEIDFGECERCSRGFSTVQDAVLTLYQHIITGDSWGLISIPIIEKSPLLGVSLCAIQLIVGVGAMNLILAVVVDRAVEAREANKDHVLSQKLKDQTTRKVKLIQRIAAMDTDNSGCVSREEIRKGIMDFLGKAYSYDIHRAMILADVTEDDLLFAFDLLEQNADNEVSYLQLCDVLDEFQAADVRKLSVLTKLHLNKVEARLRKQDVTLEKIDIKLSRLLAGYSLRPSHSASQGQGGDTSPVDSSSVSEWQKESLRVSLPQDFAPKISEALFNVNLMETEVAVFESLCFEPVPVDTHRSSRSGIASKNSKAGSHSPRSDVKSAMAPHSEDILQVNATGDACRDLRKLTQRCCTSLRKDLEELKSVALYDHSANGSYGRELSQSKETAPKSIELFHVHL